MNQAIQKLYCYVDETGQDTAGRFFAVSILITEAEREGLLKNIEEIEQVSNKRNAKWKKARPEARKHYFEKISDLTELREKLFVVIYKDSKEYLVHTADAIAKSIRKKKAGRAIIYVDALNNAEQAKLKQQLQPSVNIPTQVRSARREENNAFIRLVDAVCGLIRDAQEGNEWAKTMIQKLKRKDILENLGG